MHPAGADLWHPFLGFLKGKHHGGLGSSSFHVCQLRMNQGKGLILREGTVGSRTSTFHKSLDKRTYWRSTLLPNLVYVIRNIELLVSPPSRSGAEASPVWRGKGHSFAHSFLTPQGRD